MRTEIRARQSVYIILEVTRKVEKTSIAKYA